MKALIILLIPSFVLALGQMPKLKKGGERAEGAGSATAATGSGECQSNSHCTYGLMPIERQGDRDLGDYIKKHTDGPDDDKGWCGAVSGMMIITAFRAHFPSIKWNSWVDELDPGMNENNRFKGILEAGNLFKTDWKYGGTSTSYVMRGLKSLIEPVETEDKFTVGDDLIEPTPFFKIDGYISTLRDKKQAHYLTIIKTNVINKRTLTPDNVRHENHKDLVMNYEAYEMIQDKGRHAIVLNGYEGDKAIIYDPWGRAYLSYLTTRFYTWQYNSSYKLKNGLVYKKDIHWDTFGKHFVEKGNDHFVIDEKISLRVHN